MRNCSCPLAPAAPAVAVFALLLLTGCAPSRELLLPEPLREARPVVEVGADFRDEAAVDEERQQLTSAQLQRLQSPTRWPTTARLDMNDVPEGLPSGPFQASFEDVPLPVFISEVFGELLDLSFQMDTAVRGAADRVTLRLSGTRSGSELFRDAVQVLSSFGVGVYPEGELLLFVLDPEAAGGQVPLLVSGRALPDVPESHRVVFHSYPLQVVRPTVARGLLTQIFRGLDLSISEDPEAGIVLLRGSPRLVRQAIGTLQVLDQPAVRGRHVLRIDPAFRDVADLSEELMDLMRAQGYRISEGAGAMADPIVLVPLASVNALMVFAAGPELLDDVRFWVRQIDLPGEAPDEIGIFRYPVQNTSADSIASVLTGLISGDSQQRRRPAEGERDRREVGVDHVTESQSRSTLIVDEPRNALIFQGTAAEWQRLRPLIVEMDVAARSVLIEVTIAEVTLSDEYASGVEWAIRNARIGGFTGALRTEDGLSLGGRGITWFPTNSSGSIRAALQAFAQSDRVSILSSPRLLVRSGESASINVGTDIPIITSAATRPDLVEEGSSAILQQVAYRKTGVLLSVTPIVHGSNRVDLNVSQEVSEARQTDTSGIDSPTILDRSIETSLSLLDGGAVMLGGLISRSSSQGESRVPGVGRIPVLGRLFRTESFSNDRTELIVLITPYILDDQDEAEAITRAFRSRLSLDALGESLSP